MTGPCISVIMPTRNRLSLLQKAVQSVLAQSYSTLEIVLSDNHSEDGTREWGQSLASRDKRVKFVRTEQPLGMRESWEFAASHATSEYVTFLGDDDALSREALAMAWDQLAKHQVRLVVWRYGNYFHPAWPDPGRRNSLLLMPFTGAVRPCTGQETLHQAFHRVATVDWPHLSNALHHRSLLNEVKLRLGCLFPSALGDHLTSALILSLVDRYLLIDRPMSLYGWWSGSFSSAVMQQNLRTVERLVAAEERLPEVPMQMRLWSNLFASALLTVQRSMDANHARLELDWARYFHNCHAEIMALRRRGLDVGHLEKEFDEALSRQPGEVREEVLRWRSAARQRSIRVRLREKVNGWPWWFRLETKLRPKLRRDRPVLLRGARIGFHDIAECAEQLDDLTRQGFPTIHRQGWACQGIA